MDSQATRFAKLLIIVVGIYSCYLLYGVYQAELYRKQPDGTRFASTAFVLLVQCICNAAIAFLAHIGLSVAGRIELKKPNARPLSVVIWMKEVLIVAAVYVFAMYSSNEALKYVPYAAQALAKSCKMVPVMVGSILIMGKRYELVKYFSVGLVTLGITLFSFMKKDGGSGHGSVKSVEDDAMALYMGVALLLGSLVLDGASGPLQERVKVYGLSSVEQMGVTNVWASAYMLIVALGMGQIGTAVSNSPPPKSYYSRHYVIIYDKK